MTQMNYHLFGRSGLRVSEISLGTMTFGNDWGWGSPKDEARKIYDAYRDAGGNFIDTANVYTNGTSERLLGEFIAGHREEVVLATKYSNATIQGDANAGGNHRKSMVQAVEASLERLGTDYIDLYWLHVWDGLTPAEEVMRALDDLVRAGKVLYIGVSDIPAWVIAQSNTMAELRGWTQYTGMQIEYSLLQRTVERDLIPVAQEYQMAVTAWSPLRGGLLTGKYLPESKSAERGARLTMDGLKSLADMEPRELATVRELVEIAQEIDASPAQVALAWLRYRPVPVIPIIGARKLSQLEENLQSLTVELRDDHLQRLEEKSAVDLGFPHDLLKNDGVRNGLFGGMLDRILATPQI